MWRVIGVSAVFIVLPHCANASVIISEIAWMGSSDSANHEWIELHNNGSEAQALDGWVLSDGQSLSIELSGLITAGSYVVLERTSDDTVSGTAFLIYTGALTNSGATLRLQSDTGALIDQVAGGESWELIGGDNVTKETAQLTQAGWATAIPTPGSVNSTSGRAPGSSDGAKSSKSSGSVMVREVVQTPKLIPSTKELSLSLLTPPAIYVNQPSTFEVLPSDLGSTVTASLQYEWNFGDLATGTGKRVDHAYEFPGEYLVTVRAHFARHDTVAEYLVKVLPVRFSLTENSEGDIQVHNDSPYDIDVSGFTLVGQGSKSFPARSRIAKNGTITIPHSTFGGTKLGQASLHDATGSAVAFLTPQLNSSSKQVRVTNAAASVPAVASSLPSPEVASTDAFIFASELATTVLTETLPETEVEYAQEVVVTEPVAPLAAAAITAPAPVARELWPLAGLLMVILFGVAGVYFGAQKT